MAGFPSKTLQQLRSLDFINKADFRPAHAQEWDGVLVLRVTGKKYEFLVEVKRSYLDRSTLNAVIGPIEPRPPAADRGAPFFGVPFLIKDLVLHAEGVACDMGSRLVAGSFVSPHDTDLMRRFKAAGLVTLGRTNAPEFGFCSTTEPVLYGPTRNPWDTGRSPPCLGRSSRSSRLDCNRYCSAARRCSSCPAPVQPTRTSHPHSRRNGTTVWRSTFRSPRATT